MRCQILFQQYLLLVLENLGAYTRWSSFWNSTLFRLNMSLHIFFSTSTINTLSMKISSLSEARQSDKPLCRMLCNPKIYCAIYHCDITVVILPTVLLTSLTSVFQITQLNYLFTIYLPKNYKCKVWLLGVP